MFLNTTRRKLGHIIDFDNNRYHRYYNYNKRKKKNGLYIFALITSEWNSPNSTQESLSINAACVVKWNTISAPGKSEFCRWYFDFNSYNLHVWNLASGGKKKEIFSQIMYCSFHFNQVRLQIMLVFQQRIWHTYKLDKAYSWIDIGVRISLLRTRNNASIFASRSRYKTP